MRSLFGFGGIILHYSQFRLFGLSSKRFRLSNPFLQFCNGSAGRGSEDYITKGKVRNPSESQRSE